MADAEYARFESMTNADLRTELKRRGCSTTGIKKDLLSKLRVAIQKQYEQEISPSVVEQVNQSLEKEKLNWNFFLLLLSRLIQ